MPAAASSPIRIQRIGRSMVHVTVEGTAPLIMQKFGEKAKQRMADKQQGRALPREAKDPEENYEAARWRFDEDHDGIPSQAFKGAIVDSARYFKGSKITMVELKQQILVVGQGPDMLVPIEGVPKMREDPVRNDTGVADLRYRPEYWPWRVSLDIIYLPTYLTLESLLALVDASGNCGVGEWRPNSKESKTGMYGTYRLVDEMDVKVVTL